MPLSVVFRPYFDDVGIGARTNAIVGPHSIVIKGVGRQSGNVIAGHIVDVQILVAGYVSGE